MITLNETRRRAMRIKQLVAKVVIAGGLGLAAVGLGVGVANHPPSPPQVPTLPNVPAVASPELATAMANADTAREMANAYQQVPTTPATPLGGEQTRSSGVTGLSPDGWAGVTAIPLRGPLGGLLG
jgi:hypothetical protein